jgi:hypothetical protein
LRTGQYQREPQDPEDRPGKISPMKAHGRLTNAD